MKSIWNLLFGSPGLSQEEVHRLVSGEQALLLDVRTRDEFANGQVKGSINIPYEQLSERCDELPKDRPIILYCRSGARSNVAEKILRERGFTSLYNAKSWLLVSQALDRAKSNKSK